MGVSGNMLRPIRERGSDRHKSNCRAFNFRNEMTSKLESCEKAIIETWQHHPHLRVLINCQFRVPPPHSPPPLPLSRNASIPRAPPFAQPSISPFPTHHPPSLPWPSCGDLRRSAIFSADAHAHHPFPVASRRGERSHGCARSGGIQFRLDEPVSRAFHARPPPEDHAASGGYHDVLP